MSKDYCVYIITNLINNKVYIGKTKSDTTRRWRDHIKTALSLEDKKYSIHKAISKYGLNNFSFEILKYYKNEGGAFKGEKFYIKKYNSYLDGYNETKGGKVGLPRQKLNSKQVYSLIKEYIKTDVTTIYLARKYNLAKPSVLDILKRHSYLNVKISENWRYQLWLKLHRNYYPGLNTTTSSFLKLNETIIKNIFKDYAKGLSFEELSKIYNTRIGNIIFILRRETWSNIKIDKRTLKKVNDRLSTISPKKNKQQLMELKRNIFTDLSLNMDRESIAEKYKLDLNHLIKIINGTIYKKYPLDDNLSKFMVSKTTKLKDDDALSILTDFYHKSFDIDDLAIKWNKSRATIINILKRKAFKHITVTFENELAIKITNIIKHKCFSKEQIEMIFQLHRGGKNFTEIAEIINSTRKNVANLINEITYKNE